MLEAERLKVSHSIEIVDAAVMSSLDGSVSFYSIPLQGTPISSLQFQYNRDTTHPAIIEYFLKYYLNGYTYKDGQGDIGRIILRQLSQQETVIIIEDTHWRNANDEMIFSHSYWPPRLPPLGKIDPSISPDEAFRMKREGVAFMLNMHDEITRRLRDDLEKDGFLSPNTSPTSEPPPITVREIDLIPIEIVKGTRGYLEKITYQVNGCYKYGWYDGCNVMLRRLIETLIIECYEHHGISNQIKDVNDNYLYLNDLIVKFLASSAWSIGRNTKSSLPKLKSLGDQSAHSRRFIAGRQDIDKIAGDLRVVIQELFFIAKLDVT